MVYFFNAIRQTDPTNWVGKGGMTKEQAAKEIIERLAENNNAGFRQARDESVMSLVEVMRRAENQMGGGRRMVRHSLVREINDRYPAFAPQDEDGDCLLNELIGVYVYFADDHYEGDHSTSCFVKGREPSAEEVFECWKVREAYYAGQI